jgi:hypothetical protein
MKSNNLILNLYEMFILRDFTYVISGSFFLAILGYIIDVNYIEWINYITLNGFKFILFLAFSYITGLLIQEGLSWTRVIVTYPNHLKNMGEYAIQINKISKNYDIRILRILERTIYFKHIGSAIGSVAIINAIVLLIPLYCRHSKIDILLFLIMVLISIITITENRHKLKQQVTILTTLEEDIKKRHKI